MTQDVVSGNEKASLNLPRLLCLHGGGTSAEIFEVQARGIVRALAGTFRFVFVNAPFLSAPHPDIVPYFGDSGPFYRWMRWDGDARENTEEERKILSQLQWAMDEDEGRGDWVGVMGFSQGAKIAASLLWTQEKVKEGKGPFRFGVIVAGRAPVVVLDPERKMLTIPHTADISKLGHDFADWAPDNKGEHAISIPTLHVHGTRDPGHPLHKRLVTDYCKDGTARVVEWDGGHRLPIQKDDVDAVVGHMLELAREAGVMKSPLSP